MNELEKQSSASNVKDENNNDDGANLPGIDQMEDDDKSHSDEEKSSEGDHQETNDQTLRRSGRNTGKTINYSSKHIKK